MLKRMLAVAGLLVTASMCVGLAPQPPLQPDPKLTPGATLDVTKADICTPGYSKKVRNVPTSVKNQVYKEYGIASHKPGEYEVDHLISLELGGSNSIRNLWPQSYETQPWNAHVKDKLENKLHAMICSDQIDMKTAQQAIAKDWIGAYKRYVAAAPSGVKAGKTAAKSHAAKASGKKTAASKAGTAGQVWVNTESGKYFKKGSRYYGKTKTGQYMSEADAVKAGYKAAK